MPKDEYDGHWLSTNNVPEFHFLNPKPEEINIEDIATALSKTCRFGGHGSHYYSVAEHSLILAGLLRKSGYPKTTQLAGLLHDAEEAYLPDIPSPIKVLMTEALKMYNNLNHAIVDKFGLHQVDWTTIGILDKKLATIEAKHLGLWHSGWKDTGEDLDVTPRFLKPYVAKSKFLIEYDILTRP